ncbi:peptidase m61 containing protein [Coleophoma cylindrospora]|uniref:Peptidase m61 containing protein n=1 Tax=Coleophoma cylindrospora TaxID=1849047 RepID=A0A3D8QNW3_9HELO|nr:peptidase m61 containing protein [Coleophoma cylindrospora]
MAPFLKQLLQISQLVMGPLISTPESSGLAAIRVHLTPVFSSFSSASPQPRHLAIDMTLSSPEAEADTELLSLPLIIGNVPSQQYNKDALSASDASGPLDLEVRDEGNTRKWIVQRRTVGDVTVAFTATPRVVNSDTPPGPRIDLREQFGGLLGVGSTFLPLPSDRDSTSQYRCTLQWDLSKSPEGTRSVWSFGEGAGPIVRIGSLSVLRDSVIGVGPLKSFVDARADPSGEIFNVYWFGDPEFDVLQFGKDTKVLFEKMSKFFGEASSKENSYRIFLRNTPRGNGGMAFQRSFILEYDKDILRLEHTVFPVVAHEMVHNWPLLGKETDGSDQDIDTSDESWYSEGVANYYATMLPYRFGLRDKAYVMKQINDFLSGYYTSPVVNMSNSEATRISWQEPNALRLRYNRGFTYILKVGAQLRDKSRNKTTLDNVIYELLERKRHGQSYKLKDWLAILHRELGQSAVDEFYEMAGGCKLVIPQPDFLSQEFGMKLVRQDQEILELGFDPSSISDRTISGLKENTRASEAGVEDGDKILANSFMFEIGDDYQAMMNLVVKRPPGPEGKELSISYWPRAYEKAECYQITEA